MSKPPVVCDNGTGVRTPLSELARPRTCSRSAVVSCTQFVKCGFAGDNFPAHIFPSIVGRPILRSEEKIADVELKDIMIGDECKKARDMLETAYPITNGIVTNWEDMTHLYNYTFFQRLKIDPTEHKAQRLHRPAVPARRTAALCLRAATAAPEHAPTYLARSAACAALAPRGRCSLIPCAHCRSCSPRRR